MIRSLDALLLMSLFATSHAHAGSEERSYSGRVRETMAVGRYTYVRIDTGEESLWAAGPQTPVDVGDVVALSDCSPMANFYSSSLQRRFDLIYLCSSLGRAHPTEGRSVR